MVSKAKDDFPDPEIPVISVVELGVIRNLEVSWLPKVQNTQLRITVTPTYSGCPAIQQMQDDIELKLTENGYKNFEIITELSPAWTTDWMSEKAKNKLKKYGSKRVVETPTSENAITGIALGAAIKGLKPIITHQRVEFALLSMVQIINQISKWNYMTA